ncbi:methyl-accepting chemotaxis protein [Phenylobacterium kunshanense]|uniref:Chemotaxis protein n=1 Tax=Phenylobacterium kunshanense TaxID=1445034 RepID=A0A328BRR5_9CAUL|nr:methyl-accepting chemotaxis protein [Phenylobacterium kunshanense]RAK67768.1 chemotaxis protein [Phenylobacterium kunshanense]
MPTTIKARMRLSWAAGILAVLGLVGLNVVLLWLGQEAATEPALRDGLRLAMWISAGAGAAMVVGAIFGVAFFERLIVHAIERLSVSMRRLADGDYQAEVAGADRRDEIGDMVRSVLVFRENGRERARLQAEASEMHLQVERQLKETEAAFEAAGREQKRVVQAMARELSRLAAGDLSARLNETVASEYEELKSDFNRAVEALEGVVVTLSAAAGGIGSGAGQMAQAADELARRTEQQAASLVETAAAVEEITSAVKSTAGSARQATAAMDQVRGEAQTSSEVVRSAVEAMSQIETSSHEITKIIGVIDEIAFQTNLLALNAGVEAARAGDAGKGFAVVASEVRALAQRSAEAAKEIKALIAASTEQVEVGVGMVGRTGEVLQRIASQVTAVDALVAQISASAQEQATGLQEVNTAVNQMDQVVQQNAAMVEQTTAATHALNGEARELAGLVGRFKTSQPAGRPQVVAPVPAARRPAPANPVHAAREKIAAFAGGGSSDWTEF